MPRRKGKLVDDVDGHMANTGVIPRARSVECRLENADNSEVEQGQCEKVEHERRGDGGEFRFEQKNEDRCDEPRDTVATNLQDEQWEARRNVRAIPPVDEMRYILVPVY